MNTLIVTLLKQNGRVIIPDFGAFIVKTKSPLKVIFNEFLQYNDGALIGALTESENIERNDAVKKVTDFVTDLTSKLDKGESVEIPEIGVLSKSSTGKIDLNEGGKPTTQPQPEIKEEKTESVEFDLAEEKKEAPAPKTTEKPKTPPAPEKKITTVADKAAAAKAAPTQPKPKEPAKKVEATPVKNEEPEEATPIAEYYEDNSRNRLNVIVWIVLILLVNGAIVGYFLFDEEIKALFGKEKEVTEEQAIETPAITEETVIADTLPIESQEELIIDEVPEEVPEPIPASKELTGKKYYVVAGVFREESNADNFVIELRKKGYNAEKFGKIGAMHAVSYDVFPTKQEADKLMLKIKKEVDTEAWIKLVN
jgi:nucleoid DNA-binding protein